jgi:hypothetical protein
MTIKFVKQAQDFGVGTEILLKMIAQARDLAASESLEMLEAFDAIDWESAFDSDDRYSVHFSVRSGDFNFNGSYAGTGIRVPIFYFDFYRYWEVLETVSEIACTTPFDVNDTSYGMMEEYAKLPGELSLIGGDVELCFDDESFTSSKAMWDDESGDSSLSEFLHRLDHIFI